MPLETIIIARHGFRQNWISPTWSSPTGMNRDPPLASYGLEQAQRFAEHLNNPPDDVPKPDLIFTSGFYRCCQTALPLARAIGIPLRVELGIGEWYSPVPPGPPRLLHPRPSLSTLTTLFPSPSDLHPTYTSTVYPSRAGESLAALLARARLFISAFVPRIEAEFPEARTILLVGHAASVIALGRALTGDTELEVTAGCASYSVYKRPTEEGVKGWSIEKNGEAGFLEKGVERNWSFADVTLGTNGEVIDDPGEVGTEHEVDEPIGLADGMEHYVPVEIRDELNKAATAASRRPGSPGSGARL